MAAELSESKKRLDAFLVDNVELESLNARLAAFNMFRVLRIEKAEIRHSNVLAWLLTPGDTHGLGDMFLRRFMSRLLMENEFDDVTLTPAQVELMSFADVEVLREWHYIDVLARSRSGNWCLLIENKIESKESEGQLKRGKDHVRDDMPDAQIVPVLLTVEGDDPSEAGKRAGFVPLSHAEVLDLSERIIEQNRQRIPGNTATFLDQYLDVLRRITMQDTELVDLCKTIYRKHRDAINLIVEYGASSEVLDVCEEHIPKIVPVEYTVRKGRSIWFVPKKMGKHEPTVQLSDWKHLPRSVAVACWFKFSQKGKLHVVLEVGPVADSALRIRFLRAVKKAGFKFNEKNAFKEGAKYTSTWWPTSNGISWHLRSSPGGRTTVARVFKPWWGVTPNTILARQGERGLPNSPVAKGMFLQ